MRTLLLFVAILGAAMGQVNLPAPCSITMTANGQSKTVVLDCKGATYISDAACVPTTLESGQSSVCTATLNQAVTTAWPQGFTISLAFTGGLTSKSASLTIPAGGTSGTIIVTYTAPPTGGTATVSTTATTVGAPGRISPPAMISIVNWTDPLAP